MVARAGRPDRWSQSGHESLSGELHVLRDRRGCTIRITGGNRIDDLEMPRHIHVLYGALDTRARVIDIRIEPSSADHALTRVALPVSPHNSRWKSRSARIRMSRESSSAADIRSAAARSADTASVRCGATARVRGERFQCGAHLEQVSKFVLVHEPDEQAAPEPVVRSPSSWRVRTASRRVPRRPRAV